MSGPRAVHEVVGVDVDHGLGVSSGGFVGFRVHHDMGHAYGQLTPDMAREIAGHLFESAARAEYEQDLHGELIRVGMPADGIALVMHAVRTGEIARHTKAAG